MRNLFVGPIWLILLVTGCASGPASDYDLNYNFSELMTFSVSQVVHSDDPLSAGHIETATRDVLSAKGFRPVEQAPDFIVSYNFYFQDKPGRTGLSVGLGTGSWGSSGGVSVGTSVGVPLGSGSRWQVIVIDILEGSGGGLIWRGRDDFKIRGDGEEKAAETRKTVARILSEFPPSN